MYYDSKSSFYVKQYGPKVFIIVFSLLLVSAGLYIYMRNNKTTPNIDVAIQQEKTQKSEPVSSPEEKKEDTTTSTILPENLNNLKALERKTVKIASIEANGNVIVIDGETKFEATLIGLDFDTVQPDTIYTMGQDIQGRQVEISFDNTKNDDKVAYIYIYKENELYNAKLLENGKLKLKVNDAHTLLLNDLTESQAFAKQTRAGVWEY